MWLKENIQSSSKLCLFHCCTCLKRCLSMPRLPHTQTCAALWLVNILPNILLIYSRNPVWCGSSAVSSFFPPIPYQTNMHTYTPVSAPGCPSWYAVVMAEGNGFHFSLMPVGQGAIAGHSFIIEAQQGPMSLVGIHYVSASHHKHPTAFCTLCKAFYISPDNDPAGCLHSTRHRNPLFCEEATSPHLPFEAKE